MSNNRQMYVFERRCVYQPKPTLKLICGESTGNFKYLGYSPHIYLCEFNMQTNFDPKTLKFAIKFHLRRYITRNIMLC